MTIPPGTASIRKRTPVGEVPSPSAKGMQITRAICHHLQGYHDRRLRRLADIAVLGGRKVLAIHCCFTSLLPSVLMALGLSGLFGVVYNVVVLLPVLAGFLLLMGYALWRQKKQKLSWIPR